MEYAANIAMTLPELVLALGAIALMLVSAWGGDTSTRAVSIASVFVLVGAGIVTILVMAVAILVPSGRAAVAAARRTVTDGAPAGEPLVTTE